MKKIILLLFISFTYFTAFSQTDLRKKIDSIAQLGVEQGIPGIQILIDYQGQKEIFQYGSQNLDKNDLVNDSTLWRFGSITKLFTTIIILQLESEGVLKTSDLVTQYLNLGRHNKDSITIHHLLNHTSGLYNYTASGKLSFRKLLKGKAELTMEQCAQYAFNKKLYFEPGTKLRYCNTGFTLLGLIIEKVTQKSIQKNYEERIFVPCKLSSMEYSIDEEIPGNLARGYIKNGKRYIDYTEVHHGWANSAGAILGSLADLAEFNRFVFNGKLLDSVQVKKMITPTYMFGEVRKERASDEQAIGLSYFLNLRKNGQAFYASHGGNTLGYNCDIHYNLENNLTIVLGMNLFPNGKFKPVFSTQNALLNIIHDHYARYSD